MKAFFEATYKLSHEMRGFEWIMWFDYMTEQFKKRENVPFTDPEIKGLVDNYESIICSFYGCDERAIEAYIELLNTGTINCRAITDYGRQCKNKVKLSHPYKISFSLFQDEYDSVCWCAKHRDNTNELYRVAREAIIDDKFDGVREEGDGIFDRDDGK